MNRNDLRRLDMNLLVIFESLMIERNLTRVGEKLFITQSTVSAAPAGAGRGAAGPDPRTFPVPRPWGASLSSNTAHR